MRIELFILIFFIACIFVAWKKRELGGREQQKRKDAIHHMEH